MDNVQNQEKRFSLYRVTRNQATQTKMIGLEIFMTQPFLSKFILQSQIFISAYLTTPSWWHACPLPTLSNLASFAAICFSYNWSQRNSLFSDEKHAWFKKKNKGWQNHVWLFWKIELSLTLWEPAYDIFVLQFQPKKQQFSVALPTP